MEEARPIKILGIKAYGHIPHLPGSRMGPGDHRISDGQARIATEERRDRHDIVIVQEKLDGTCVAVARVGEVIIPLIRSGYRADSSKYLQHRMFAAWVYTHQRRFIELLKDGECVVGEWLAQAHGTRYALPHEPFVAFDLMTGLTRTPYRPFIERTTGLFITPQLISYGEPVSIEDAMEQVQRTPLYHGAIDPVEGCVWRVERKGEVDFLCKFVRHDKVDGQYLPSVTGQSEVWNWQP